ncbi:MAG: PIG-L family deacetylase, partial [Rothia mucilaginosa]
MSETENTQPDSATPSYPTQGERIAPGSRRDLLPNNYDAKKARILFVHAHPDDETSSTGATMAYYAQKGAEVYLLTATRGELGEVIPEELHHLEVGKPGCRDNGEALGEYRTGELAGAIKALGVKKQFFLGQEPAVAEGTLPLYRDSGMAWGPEGKPVANPVAAEDSLTAQPLEPQAQALVAAIRALTPDVLITYDSDGGYGHPDHVRVYEIVHRALQILEDDEDRPILTWGIEGEFDTADQRVQAAIYGDGTAKRKAMEAHRTQITVVDEKTFEYSNKVPQKISSVETFRVLDGD